MVLARKWAQGINTVFITNKESSAVTTATYLQSLKGIGPLFDLPTACP